MPVNNENTSNELPSHARVFVIGGGVIGTSVAYNLAEMGCSDVVLLERDSLTSGTTWHAAGLLQTFGSMSETSTEVRISSLELYKRLEAETGQATGLNQCGVIEIATDLGSLEEYRRVAAINRISRCRRRRDFSQRSARPLPCGTRGRYFDRFLHQGRRPDKSG